MTDKELSNAWADVLRINSDSELDPNSKHVVKTDDGTAWMITPKIAKFIMEFNQMELAEKEELSDEDMYTAGLHRDLSDPAVMNYYIQMFHQLEGSK